MTDETQGIENSRRIQSALEPVVERMKATKGFNDEEIGLALLAVGLNCLSSTWSGEHLVGHLANLTAAMADMHRIDPETGKAGVDRSVN